MDDPTGDGGSLDGWAALRAGDWAAAREAFEAEAGEAGEALDGLARSRWWTSDVPGAVEAWERAYAAYRSEGREAAASRVCLFLFTEHEVSLAEYAVARGWLARARRLVDGLPPGPELGWLRVAEAEIEPDAHASLGRATEALELGRRHRDPDLELIALGRVGLAEIWLGRVEDGMGRYEEAMAAATSGEPKDIRTVGDLYCSMMLAAEATLDADRFSQWNRKLFGYMARNHHPDALTFCGTCCAEVLGANGEWPEAEKWLTDTLHTLQDTGQQARCVHPATRLASLRILQGRLEEAEELLRGYEDLPEATQPLVALYLARGQVALAAARLHRRLNQVGRDSLRSVPLLVQLVDVLAAQGDAAGAKATAEDLDALAQTSGLPRVRAEAELAAGTAASLGGEVDEGAVHMGSAVELFTVHHLPHRAARAHFALARAVAEQDRERAVEEARHALEGFDRLGAAHDADLASGFLRELGVAGRTGPKLLADLSRRELEVLRLLGYGLTNAEIAARLYISTKTVATHVGHIFEKLHVRNRAEAATYAQRYLGEDIRA